MPRPRPSPRQSCEKGSVCCWRFPGCGAVTAAEGTEVAPPRPVPLQRGGRPPKGEAAPGSRTSRPASAQCLHCSSTHGRNLILVVTVCRRDIIGSLVGLGVLQAETLGPLSPRAAAELSRQQPARDQTRHSPVLPPPGAPSPARLAIMAAGSRRGCERGWPGSRGYSELRVETGHEGTGQPLRTGWGAGGLPGAPGAAALPGPRGPVSPERPPPVSWHVAI